jgi:hypothetical protein
MSCARPDFAVQITCGLASAARNHLMAGMSTRIPQKHQLLLNLPSRSALRVRRISSRSRKLAPRRCSPSYAPRAAGGVWGEVEHLDRSAAPGSNGSGRREYTLGGMGLEDESAELASLFARCTLGTVVKMYCEPDDWDEMLVYDVASRAVDILSGPDADTPPGSCVLTALALRDALRTNGVEGAELKLGYIVMDLDAERSSAVFHAWVDVDGKIIDLSNEEMVSKLDNMYKRAAYIAGHGQVLPLETCSATSGVVFVDVVVI